MQNSELKNWYKSSFEAIKGKPAPDVWHAIESEIPDGKGNLLRQFLFVLVPALVIGVVWFAWPSVSQDYMPRISAFKSVPHLSDLIDYKQSYWPKLTRSSYVPLVEKEDDEGVENSTPNLTGRIETFGSVKARVNAPDLELPQSGEKSNLTSKDLNLNPAFIFKPVAIETRGAVSVVAPSKPEGAPFTHASNYIGAAFRLSSVNILNHSFQKAANSETLNVNEIYVKPSYSILFGRQLRKSMYLELSASKVDLGQAISSYDEGLFTTSRESLSYFGVGVGVVKYKSSDSKLRPYCGVNVEGRFLLKSNLSNQTNEFSKLDFAFCAKGGLSYCVNHYTLGAGLVSSVSIGNSTTSEFESARNLAAGLEIMVTRSF